MVGKVRQPNETALETANRMLRLAFDESMDFPTPIHLGADPNFRHRIRAHAAAFAS
jgi:hypothetical protein